MIKFGPSGSDEVFASSPQYKGTVDMPLYVKSLGLDCFEYSFGKGVRMSAETAVNIGSAFAKEGIEISVHAPYFINFANPDPAKIDNSFGYVVSSLEALKALGGNRCVFHPGSPLSRTREEAWVDLERNVARLAEILHEQGLDDMRVCPETMGKLNQMGTVEDIAKLCALDKVFTPCVDFGHVNAREQGSLKTADDFKRVIDTFAKYIEWERVSSMHVHFSKIEYTAKGEKCHLTFDDTVFGPEFEPLADVLAEYEMEPYIVSESAGTQGRDAVYMRDAYLKAVQNRLG